MAGKQKLTFLVWNHSPPHHHHHLHVVKRAVTTQPTDGPPAGSSRQEISRDGGRPLLGNSGLPWSPVLRVMTRANPPLLPCSNEFRLSQILYLLDRYRQHIPYSYCEHFHTLKLSSQIRRINSQTRIAFARHFFLWRGDSHLNASMLSKHWCALFSIHLKVQRLSK